jgi:hypothetical protein
MDPFTIALATFGVQKLRGKSTRRALRDAALLGGGAYGLGQLGGVQAFQGAPLSSLGFGQAPTPMPKGDLGTSFLNRANLPEGTVIGTDKFGKEIVSRGGPLEGLNVIETPEPSGLAALVEKVKEKPLQSALIGSAVLPFLAEEEPVKPPFTEEDYRRAYEEQSAKLEGAFVPAENTMPSRSDVYGSNMFYANEGGLAEVVKKFNEGGVTYLPSKSNRDENDANNYMRATGYVEDGAGNGDKDEDTMLAQLADGEFVSRADAVLGAGILSGADPKSFKSMRKAGADFFYDQQKKFKRVYDLLNASKQN